MPGSRPTSLAWLPDNRHLLAKYFNSKSDRNQIAIVTVPSGEFRSITNDVNAYSELTLSADGHTLATVLTNIVSSLVSYKAEGGAPTANVPLRVSPASIAWVTEDRLLFIIPGVSLGSIDRATGTIQTYDLGARRIGNWFAACPDGQILFTNYPSPEGDAHLFRMNADGGEIAQISVDGVVRAPFCSADSKQVYFNLSKGPETSLWVIPIAGGAPKQVLHPSNSTASSVSRDGKMAATVVAEHQKFSARITNLTSTEALPAISLEESVANNLLHFSLDGRAVVYAVRRADGYNLIYEPIDGYASKLMLAPINESISAFDWSPSGKELATIRSKSTADVVLITDQAVKGNN